jgi:hypothetical protein
MQGEARSARNLVIVKDIVSMSNVALIWENISTIFDQMEKISLNNFIFGCAHQYVQEE